LHVTRGVQDVLIAVVDGLNGFPDAINAVFPQTQVQTCIVHLLRHALSFAPWKDRRELAAAEADLRGGERRGGTRGPGRLRRRVT
jgi:putative transposase